MVAGSHSLDCLFARHPRALTDPWNDFGGHGGVLPDPIVSGAPRCVALEHYAGLQAGEEMFSNTDTGALDAGDGIRRRRFYQQAAGRKWQASLVDELAHTGQPVHVGRRPVLHA
jgi:hypothetical protein